MTPDNPLTYAHARHSHSRFADVDLNDAIFTDVALQRARFDNVALSGAQFDNVDLRDVAIRDANLEGMTINGVLVADLLRAYESGQVKQTDAWIE
jgi:uncharacterized protein YjbI with pentapeptide repeats